MLSDRDREIIAAAMLQADQRPQRIAEITGYREHVVRYTLQKALSEGIIIRRTFVNVYALGYMVASVHCSLTAMPIDTRRRLIRYLVENPTVSYLAELAGDFDLSINFCVPSARDLQDCLSRISEKFGNWYKQRIISTLVAISDYPLKFISRKKINVKPLFISAQAGAPTVNIDKLDHRILCHLSQGIEEHELPRTLGTPRSTVSYRVRRLRDEGVIVGTRFIADFRPLKLQVFKCHLTLASDKASLRDALREFCREHPSIAYSLDCVGFTDFRFAYAIENVHDIAELVTVIRTKFSNDILDLQLFPYIQLWKSSFYPFEGRTFPPYRTHN